MPALRRHDPGGSAGAGAGGGGGHEGDDDDFFLNEGKEDGGGGSGRAKAPDSVRDKSHHRSDVNILLIGDPGTSKSQLLSYVHKVMEK